MVRNGHSVILFPKWLLSNITYGTKWLWCKIHNSFQLTQEIMKMLFHLVSIHFTINWYKWIKLLNSYVILRIFLNFPAGYITLI